jgi:hypothetical protein
MKIFEISNQNARAILFADTEYYGNIFDNIVEDTDEWMEVPEWKSE